MSDVHEHCVGLAFADPRGGYADRSALTRVIGEAVASALGEADTERPLSTLIPAGATVLLKPNWVQDFNRSGATMDCMVTQQRFIEAVLEHVLAASPAKVIIADAPLQSANFELLAPVAWQRHVKSLGGSVPVEVVDLRNVITVKEGRRYVHVSSNRRTDHLVLFDLGISSLLESISEPSGRFRCTNYDPDRIIAVQRPGVHKYVLAREPLEADVILNLPKLKTHCKAGLTAALKNLVGLNGDKDYLPHHRIGSPANGGDCYAAPHFAKRSAERMFDIANRRIGRRGYRVAALFAGAAARVALPIGIGGLDGGWHGNDTVWRMALDLNRILLYGRADGTMSDRPLRKIYTLTDAIVCGEGEGPLAPTPLELGAVTFAASSAYADLVHSALMHFDWQRIPLVREAFREMRWPLVAGTPADVEIRVNGDAENLKTVLERYGRRFRAPRGWQGQIERSPVAVEARERVVVPSTSS